MDSLDLCLICGSHVPNSDVAYCSQNCRDIDLSPQNNTLISVPLQYPVHVSRSSSSSYHSNAVHRSPSSPTYTGRDRHGISVWASRVSGGGSYGDHQQPDMSSTFESDEEDEDEDTYEEAVHVHRAIYHHIPQTSAPSVVPPPISSLPRYKFPLTPSQPAPAAISLIPNARVPVPSPKKAVHHRHHQSTLSTSSSDATSLETPFTPASSASSAHQRMKWNPHVEDPFISSPPYDYTLRPSTTKHASNSPRQFVDRGRSLYRADGW